jgi:hypothetical protein
LNDRLWAPDFIPKNEQCVALFFTDALRIPRDLGDWVQTSGTYNVPENSPVSNGLRLLRAQAQILRFLEGCEWH